MVISLEVDQMKLDLVNQGKSYIKHIAAETIHEMAKARTLCASTDFSRITQGRCDPVISL